MTREVPCTRNESAKNRETIGGFKACGFRIHELMGF